MTNSDIMWLKTFKFNEKALSEVELMVLSSLSDQQFTTAGDLIESMDNNLDHWTPERGTIYPLLHRLSDQKLIDKKEGKNLIFKRTLAGSNFLSSLISSDFYNQFETSIKYLEIIGYTTINVDPYASKEFLEKCLRRIEMLKENFNSFIEELNSKIEEEGWKEIGVE